MTDLQTDYPNRQPLLAAMPTRILIAQTANRANGVTRASFGNGMAQAAILDAAHDRSALALGRAALG